MSYKVKARFARLDADRNARPLTQIVAHFPAGKVNFVENATDYMLVDTNPHSEQK